MGTKALITQYGAGSRSPECVQAYRDYHRDYQRGWNAARREHQAAAETIEQEIIAELREEKCE